MDPAKMAVGMVATISPAGADLGKSLMEHLFNRLHISKETRERAAECQKEMSRIRFQRFEESSACKTVKGIAEEEFPSFVKRLSSRLKFTPNVEEALLDILYARECEETVKEFIFNDGHGKIHRGRVYMEKKDKLIDIAYAVYSLNFHMTKEEREIVKSSWLFGLITTKKEVVKKLPQNLTEETKNKFSEWCLVKLHDGLIEEYGHELEH